MPLLYLNSSLESLLTVETLEDRKAELNSHREDCIKRAPIDGLLVGFEPFEQIVH
jgi:hypothetical protein